MRAEQQQTVKMAGLTFGSELKKALYAIKFEDSDSKGEMEQENA